MNNDKKRLRDVIYPQIKQCEEYVSDPFWKNLFDDMSRGKCPKSIVIFNNTVSSIYKRGGFTYNFQNKEAQEIAEDLVEILQSTGCIYSEQDMIREQQEIKHTNQTNSQTVYKNWKQIKTKKIKQQYIHDYVLRQSVKYKLSDAASKHLINLINSSLNEYKTHRSDDIIFKNNEIVDIEDIVYDENLKFFINQRELEDKDELRQEVNLIKKTWEKYVLSVYKETKFYLE